MKFILVFTVLMFNTGVAFSANSTESDFYLYPHGTRFDFDNFNGLNIKTDDGLGFAMGSFLDDNWGLELSYDKVNSRLRQSGIKDSMELWQLNSIYRFDSDVDAPWKPFFFAGIGNINHQFAFQPRYKADGSTFNLGVGALYNITHHISLRVDVRDVHTFDHGTHNIMTTVGFAYENRDNHPPVDSDGDGIYDPKDRCPDTNKGVSVDNSGCELDSDNDGVVNSKDQCPSTLPNLVVNAKGCELDDDQDSVVNHLDKCPNTPQGAKVDQKGCKKILKKSINLTLSIEFKTNSAVIDQAHQSQLEKLANLMRQYPDAAVLIAGYTDDRGAANYNLKLSQRRAQAVVDYLVSHFDVQRNRMVAQGFGESKPVASNTTVEGRQANRRVVAIINNRQSHIEK